MKSQYCDVTKVGSEILNAMGNENTWDIIDKENKDFKRGAMWGMAWVMNYVYAYTPKINMIERYPCNHCGECPVWLAAFDAKEVKTYDKVLKACARRNCELVGKVVEEEY